MKLVLLLTIIALAYAKRPTWDVLDKQAYSFNDYVIDFNKQYGPAEIEYRREIFESNLRMIKNHNSQSFHSYKMGVNQLTDYTDEEYNKLLGYKSHPSTKATRSTPFISMNDHINTLPASVDWRDKGVVSDVKDQGQCGSCWTFATAEVIESHYAIATGQLQIFSEQQILDCVPNPNSCGGNGGCQGGTPEIIYEKLIEIGGLASEWTYPYVSYFGKNFQCHYNASATRPIAVLKSYVKLPANEYQPVMDALANIGPLAINIDASAWRYYETGVFSGCNTTDSDIDHVVLLVGYGTDPKLGDYWIVRNSWTPSWGEAGYIRLPRTSQVQCTPDTQPQDGTGCNGGPTEVTVCGACGILYDVSYPIMA